MPSGCQGIYYREGKTDQPEPSRMDVKLYVVPGVGQDIPETLNHLSVGKYSDMCWDYGHLSHLVAGRQLPGVPHRIPA